MGIEGEFIAQWQKGLIKIIVIRERSDSENQLKSNRYYDRFAKVYDWVSSDAYYRKPRQYALEKLKISKNHNILNIPCGTGQNFQYLEKRMGNTGHIFGVDFSQGMLSEARKKIQKEAWQNITLFCEDARKITPEWIDVNVEENLRFDSILCDLGLSGFPDWQLIIDQLLCLLKSEGKLVIMDWYIEKDTLRAKFIKWIGKGKVNRPLYQYLETKVDNFELNTQFKAGDMFVALGTKRQL